MRFLIKLLLLPVVMILSLMKLVIDGATKIYCLVAGVAINLLVISAVLAVVTGQWLALGIFAMVFVGVIVVLFFAGTISVVLDGLKERLKAV
ncbi:hypothetical protein [Acetivibrio ethanolgignens]|uniref:Uncharacterized protein n=1 Tax=Acetivibrio ethanolgignens TaxID=290052 RepID=A0A0V8QJ45_9FIRM|nr:hypothetical protein [Acetivibrio ethanolgignens]KSV60591.1 hypothetical protein ASU35_05310 [Acetivibrio ethanolgignens]